MAASEANHRKRPDEARNRGFLARLREDRRGNTLALMAMSLIPIAGMIGSGLDMSRGYMTKAKLQTACDSAALATRRFMAGSAFTDAAEAEGEKFFNFNFPEGTMGTEDVDLDIRQDPDDASRVLITAETAVPTTVMSMFGKEAMELAITCSADQDFVNNDIMLVLDVTSSMFCTAGTTCEYQGTEQTSSRLSRLRNAAASLYTALDGADDQGARIRYGFMPYSMSVNVGDDLQRTWMRNPAQYWQRVNDNWQFRSVTHSDSWFTGTWDGCVEERRNYASRGNANIRISSTVDQQDIDTTGTTGWMLWQPYDDVATQREYNEYGIAALTRFCPAPATRLAEYDSEDDFQDVIDDALARVGGYTNHDSGIMWAARYLSSTGMFQAANPTQINDMPVNKHIVFLTDGVMTAYMRNYSAFGIPEYDARMTGTQTGTATEQEVKRHKARFLNACNRARQMGMTIWVIALDVQAPGDISPCASGNDHFYQSNGSDLDDIFELIGKGIGKLRITE